MTTEYNFPFETNKSVTFEASGATITKAVLIANDIEIGLVTFTDMLGEEYDEDYRLNNKIINEMVEDILNDKDGVNICNLRINKLLPKLKPSLPIHKKLSDKLKSNIDLAKHFPLNFWTTPFHAGLAKKWNCKIKLHVEDERIPSLHIINTNDSRSWEQYPSGKYEEKVTLGSGVSKTFLYAKQICGYKLIS